MIICDRCQKNIPASEFETVPPGFLSDDLVACLPCKNEFRKGVDKITDEVRAERNERIEKWRDEWQRNFKGISNEG